MRNSRELKFVKLEFRKLDVITLFTMMLLLCVGIYCIKQEGVAAGDFTLYKKQIFGVGLGLAMLFVILFVDYRFICKYSIFLYIAILLVLAYTLKFGDKINNVSRWVTIAGIQLQPSELTKVVLILFLAFLLDYFKDQMDKFRTFFILCGIVGLPLILILLEPHLSTSLVIVFIFIAMLYLSGLSYRIIGTMFAIVVPLAMAIIISVGVFNVNLPFIKPYQVKRILTFFSDDKEEDSAGKYQQNQAVTAVASGGKNGKITSSTSSARAYNGIYANESDFVFSIVGEEFGFIGCGIILCLYLILVVRSLTIAAHAPDHMGKMICYGVSAMLMFQVFVNIGVATSILPNTGLPLPFISYGLTSLITSISAVAIVLNVGLRRAY